MKIIKKILGIVLIGICVYAVFNTQFLIRVIDGTVCDGLSLLWDK